MSGVTGSQPRHLAAFGLDIDSALDLPGRWHAATGHGIELRVRPAPADALAGSAPDAEGTGWTGTVDGLAFSARGQDGGGLLMQLGERVRMRLTGDRAELLVPEDTLDDALALRLLFDTALFTASLELGNCAIHAAAVVAPTGRAVAICGPSGSGKSSLLAALLDAGCGFLTDDVLVVSDARGRVVGAPGPPASTLPADLGIRPWERETLAHLESERWVTVHEISSRAEIVALVELVDSRSGVPGSWAAMLGHFLRFPSGAGPERQRFEMATLMHEKVRRLPLPSKSAAPAVLAERVLDWLQTSSEQSGG